MRKAVEYPTLQYAENIRRYLSLADTRQHAEGLEWYRVAGDLARAIGERTNIGTECVAAVIAALSPRNKMARNIADTAAFCEAASRGETVRPTACTFDTNSDKAWAIANEVGWHNILSGRKVESFVANITGDLDRVTVDTWAVRAATAGAEDTVKNERHYAAIELAYRLVADERGLRPAEVQAIAWVVVRDRCESLNGKRNVIAGRIAALAV